MPLQGPLHELLVMHPAIAWLSSLKKDKARTLSSTLSTFNQERVHLPCLLRSLTFSSFADSETCREEAEVHVQQWTPKGGKEDAIKMTGDFVFAL